MTASLLGMIVKSLPDSSMPITMLWYSLVFAVSFLRSISSWTWSLSTGAYVREVSVVTVVRIVCPFCLG